MRLDQRQTVEYHWQCARRVPVGAALSGRLRGIWSPPALGVSGLEAPGGSSGRKRNVPLSAVTVSKGASGQQAPFGL